MEQRPQRQPGDLILDRYMPNATPEEREAARANLTEFAALIFRFCVREAERRQEAIRTNGTRPVK